VGGVPTAGEVAPVTLNFPANSGSLTPLDDISGLVVDGITFDGGGYNLQGNGVAKLTFRRVPVGSLSILCTNSAALSDEIDATLPLVFNATAIVKADNILNLDSTLSGVGGLSTQGDIWLRGITANTYTFTTTVTSGTLHLAKTAGLSCFAGALTADGGTVRNEAGEQAPNSSTVTLKNGGTWETNSYAESFGPLHFDGGTLQGGPGVSLLGDITSTALSGAITGSMTLGGADRTINVAANGDLDLSASISDGGASADIIKTGLGLLSLSGANTFGGGLYINTGECRLVNNLALGTSGGFNQVNAGSTLSFAKVGGQTITNENVQLFGSLLAFTNTTWTGSISLNSLTTAIIGGNVGVNFTHSGMMNGQKLIKNGDCRLTLSGTIANIYTGGTVITGGEILLSKTAAIAIPGSLQIDAGTVTYEGHDQIANSSTVMMNGGLLDLSAYSDTIGSLAGPAGEVQISFGTLTTGSAGSTTFSGLLSGLGGNSLVKTGLTTFTLDHATNGGNTLAGTILVNQGTLLINGIQQGSVTANVGGYLSGTGTIQGAVNILSGGIGLGLLKTGNLTINGGGSNANVSIKSGGYNHAAVTGNVNLTGSALNLTVAYNPYVGASYTLIDNDAADPITGTFVGLPEGALLAINTQTFQLSYLGGTGNDVVLSLVSGGLPVPTISTFTLVPIINSDPAQFTVLIAGNGQPNTAHHLQTSTDLVLWQDIPGTLTSDAQGLFSTTFPTLAAAKRFYRLAIP
jgi:fibronectin-binding autotransporter adhesin